MLQRNLRIQYCKTYLPPLLINMNWGPWYGPRPRELSNWGTFEHRVQNVHSFSISDYVQYLYHKFLPLSNYHLIRSICDHYMNVLMSQKKNQSIEIRFTSLSEHLHPVSSHMLTWWWLSWIVLHYQSVCCKETNWFDIFWSLSWKMKIFFMIGTRFEWNKVRYSGGWCIAVFSLLYVLICLIMKRACTQLITSAKKSSTLVYYWICFSYHFSYAQGTVNHSRHELPSPQYIDMNFAHTCGHLPKNVCVREFAKKNIMDLQQESRNFKMCRESNSEQLRFLTRFPKFHDRLSKFRTSPSRNSRRSTYVVL